MEIRTKIAYAYFSAWNTLNSEVLKPFFTDGVCLEDWEVNVEGLTDVLNANQSIFESVPGIKVEPISVVGCPVSNVVIGILKVHTPHQILDVVDVIRFTDDYKICSIKAYRGH